MTETAAGELREAREVSEARSVDEYRIVRPLGHDPRGGTFLAHDRTLDRPVVLSFLATTADASLAGARALARVTHPNLCRVHRVRDAVARPYVVSAFARGSRLDTLADGLSETQVLEIGRALVGAVATMHAAGVAHGDIRAARVTLSAEGEPLLFGLEQARAEADDSLRRTDVAGLVGLLESIGGPDLQAQLRELARHGPPTAEELGAELEKLAHAPARREPTEDENPYRGLRPFEAEHSAAFFGRQLEIAELVTRLRGQPLLLVAGRSGTGKSSLVRAGIAPAIGGGKIGERKAWDVATMVPGSKPLEALAARLAPLFGREAGELCAALRKNPELAGRLARRRTDRGLLLVVDQLEELLTVADDAEREAFGDVVARLSALAPGVRVVMTVRSDFLGHLRALGPLGRDLLRSTYVLPPMGRDALREAAEGPARARGFAFEEGALVDSLLDEVVGRTEALPLLSFALAELWLARDEARRVLPAAALERLGGAAAALARHGDMVLATLRPDERSEARRLLLALVTAEETRARPTEEELLGSHGGPAGERARVALAALVRGRLVVAGETFEIAHEALVHAWPRLRTWLDEASEGRAAAARLAVAAREWVRLGRGTEGLAGGRLLRDLETPGALEEATDDGRAFVAASRVAVRRTRWRRRVLQVGVPAMALLLAGAIAGGIRWNERRQARAFVAVRLAEAASPLREAGHLEENVSAARADGFARYAAGDAAGGEARLSDALTLARRESDAFVAASAPLGLALALDPLDPAARVREADLVYAWILAAERDHEPDVARDLLGRLALFDDDGSRRARLAAPARLRVTTAPPGVRVVLHGVRLDANGRRVEGEGRPIDLEAPMDLPPGSYVLVGSAPGRYATRFPVFLVRGQDERVEIPLPAAAAVPPGFVFVPRGISLVGASDVEGVRSAINAELEHPIHVGSFLIAEHEVTYAEYLDFLAMLPASERAARRPHGANIDLAYDPDGVPRLNFTGTTAGPGDTLCHPKRTVRRCQRWSRFPVAGISWDDAQAYVAWLARGRVPGARLCSEREWERAARGADGRLYTGGDVLHPGDVNVDEAYGSEDQLGVDEVESYAADESPFGVFDLGGNVSEWIVQGSARAVRGAYWGDAPIDARAAFRRVPSRVRGDAVGMRVCADAPSTP